jgi:hypothetical protein
VFAYGESEFLLQRHCKGSETRTRDLQEFACGADGDGRKQSSEDVMMACAVTVVAASPNESTPAGRWRNAIDDERTRSLRKRKTIAI